MASLYLCINYSVNVLDNLICAGFLDTFLSLRKVLSCKSSEKPVDLSLQSIFKPRGSVDSAAAGQLTDHQ